MAVAGGAEVRVEAQQEPCALWRHHHHCWLGLIGVLINYVYPTNAFEIVMNLAGIGIAGTWISILVSHLIFTSPAVGRPHRAPQLPAARVPYTNIVAILFFVAVIGSMWFDPDVGRIDPDGAGGVVVLMVAGWFAVRKRIHAELMDTILDDDGAAAPGLDDDGAAAPGLDDDGAEAPGTDGNAAGTS